MSRLKEGREIEGKAVKAGKERKGGDHGGKVGRESSDSH